MSAAAKKKAKKKAKEKAKKEAGGDAAPAAASGKKVSAKVRALQELQELRRREEEAARIAEEERLRQVSARWTRCQASNAPVRSGALPVHFVMKFLSSWRSFSFVLSTVIVLT